MIAIDPTTAQRNRPERTAPAAGPNATRMTRGPRWRDLSGGAFTRRRWAAALAVVVAIAVFLSGRPALAADAKAEAAAQEAIAKAEKDYQGKALGKALYRLGKALHACAKDRCTDATVAALVRDSGSIHVRQRDRKGAAKLFARAIGLVADLELSPAYDSPDVRAVWEAAGGARKPEPPPPAPPAAPLVAIFAHAPAAEQRAGTPLPVYVEGGPATVERVTLHYAFQDAHAAGESWRDVTLERVGTGWGGVVPCADVTLGSMRYFVEGLDAAGAKVAAAGDAQHPYEVPIRPAITGEAPHLPGQAAPAACVEAVPAGEVAVVQTPAPEGAPEPKMRRRRFWIGVAGSIDFMDVPSGDDLCLRNAATMRPTNGSNLYCTTLDGKDFPPASVINGTQGDIVPGQGQGGHSDGGLQLGDVRYLAAVDYALTANALVGVRVGVVTNRYQGNDAVRDKRAFGPILHAELRASWVFGHDPLIGSNVAPLVFVAGGVSEFDAQVKSNVAITQGTPPSQTQLPVPVNIWHTDGPGFVGAGVGLRLTIGSVFAISPAVRGSLVFGGNGVVPVFGPELTLQFGF